jgi:hypothetical protein
MKRFTVAGIVLCLSIFALAAFSIAADKAGSQKAEEPKATLTGKIGFMQNLGGYFLKGENPPEESMIVNQNKKVLDALFKSQKTITVIGHYTIGADHLFIEKIDGKPYKGTAK